MERGKTLAELDVKAGDVVSFANGRKYVIGGVRPNGRYYPRGWDCSNFTDDEPYYLVSRYTDFIKLHQNAE